MEYFKLLMTGMFLTAGVNLAVVAPASAFELDLSGSEIDLGDDDDSEMLPSLSTDGDQVNLEIYEQPEPETEVEIEDGNVSIERERKPARRVLDLSVPVSEE